MAEYEGTKITELEIAVNQNTPELDIRDLLDRAFLIIVTEEKEYRLPVGVLVDYIKRS